MQNEGGIKKARNKKNNALKKNSKSKIQANVIAREKKQGNIAIKEKGRISQKKRSIGK